MDPAARAAAPTDRRAARRLRRLCLRARRHRRATPCARRWPGCGPTGAELGIHVAIAADRLGAVPTALASLAQQRLAFQLADVADYAQFGLMRRAIPQFVARPRRRRRFGTGDPGGARRLRALAGRGGGGALPIASPGPRRPRAARRRWGCCPRASGSTRCWAPGRADRGAGADIFIPFGIGDETLEPAGFELYEGDHAMIAGPARTGRTTALLVVAEVLSRLYPDVPLVGIATRRSALRECPVLSRVVIAAGGAGRAGHRAARRRPTRTCCSSTTPTSSTIPPAGSATCSARPGPTCTRSSPGAPTRSRRWGTGAWGCGALAPACCSSPTSRSTGRCWA